MLFVLVLHLYNDLTREKELFKPLTPGRVLYYSCGPTVYDYFHIGNARPFIVFDVLRRYLSHIGYQVTYVQNFTDIDDKMIRRAEEMGLQSMLWRRNLSKPTLRMRTRWESAERISTRGQRTRSPLSLNLWKSS